MCGIAGIFNLNKDIVSRTVLKSMSNKIAHRGPDGQGYYLKDNIGLAHNRLAILDILESVIKNFEDYPDIIDEATSELSIVKSEQAKTNDSIELEEKN